jgi:hypothetical protein
VWVLRNPDRRGNDLEHALELLGALAERLVRRLKQVRLTAQFGSGALNGRRTSPPGFVQGRDDDADGDEERQSNHVARIGNTPRMRRLQPEVVSRRRTSQRRDHARPEPTEPTTDHNGREHRDERKC